MQLKNTWREYLMSCCFVSNFPRWLARIFSLHSPSPTGFRPIEHLVDSGHPVFAHRGHVPTGHNRVVHPRVRGQALGEHRFPRARRAAHQHVAIEAAVGPGVPRSDRDFAKSRLQLGLRVRIAISLSQAFTGGR